MNLVAGDLLGLLSWEEFDRVYKYITQDLENGWIISRQKPVEFHSNTINFNSNNQQNKNIKASKILDARKIGCQLPIINTCRALLSLTKGERLEIKTNEPGSIKDVSIICNKTGDKLVSNNQTCDGFSFVIEKI